MKSINNFFSSIAEVCNPTKGTLSGAMDVIVIQRQDGTMASTPFYVKFGRFKLLKSNKLKVDLVVNEHSTDISMELKKNGKAIFVRYSGRKKEVDSGGEKIIIEPPLSDKELSSESEDQVATIDDSIQKKERKSENPEIKTPSIDEEMKLFLDLDLPQLTHAYSSDHLSSMNAEEHKENMKLAEGKCGLVRFYRSNSSIICSSNHLSSDELKSLNLNIGLNHVKYVTKTKKNTFLYGKIYLWDYSYKIIVSDIDGTLSKSDLMGHICYMFGKD